MSKPDQLSDRRSFVVYVCPHCEWAATTGDPWDECPHCETRDARPVFTEVVSKSALDARQEAIDRALSALEGSAYVGGPSEREAWQTTLEALGPFRTEHVGDGRAFDEGQVDRTRQVKPDAQEGQ